MNWINWIALVKAQVWPVNTYHKGKLVKTKGWVVQILDPPNAVIQPQRLALIEALTAAKQEWDFRKLLRAADETRERVSGYSDEQRAELEARARTKIHHAHFP